MDGREARAVRQRIESLARAGVSQLPRATRMPPGADAASLQAAAAADPRIADQLAGRTILKVVAVPGRMVNFVLANQGSQP